jgi:hypothetical protein
VDTEVYDSTPAHRLARIDCVVMRMLVGHALSLSE